MSRRGGERILYFENGVVKRSGGRGERLVWSVAAGRVFHTSGLFSGEHSTLSFVWRAGELDEERHKSFASRHVCTVILTRFAIGMGLLCLLLPLHVHRALSRSRRVPTTSVNP